MRSLAQPSSDPDSDQQQGMETLEIAERVASIERVPHRILPESAARTALRVIAAAGADCYAYASGGEAIGTWCAWLGPLADVRLPERNGRVTLAAWRNQWHELVAEMHLAGLDGMPSGADPLAAALDGEAVDAEAAR